MTAQIQVSALRGQVKAKTLLGRALGTQRMSHAYLFRGPDGVGKKKFALALTAAVNCRNRAGMDACGICSSCKKFRAGSHPDFTSIHPEKGVIKIEKIRALGQGLSYPPYEAQVRGVVIEDVQTMRREAANSLLKTLEEPPPGNLIVLTAESSQEILPTLISRCQVIPFTSLSIEDTTAILCTREILHDEALLLARLAEGSSGRALQYQHVDMVNTWREVVGYASDRRKDPAKDVGGLLAVADKIASLKEEILPFLGLLRLWVRDMLLNDKNVALEGQFHFQLKSWSSSQLFAKLQAIDKAEKALERNCNRNLICEVLLFALQ